MVKLKMKRGPVHQRCRNGRNDPAHNERHEKSDCFYAQDNKRSRCQYTEHKTYHHLPVRSFSLHKNLLPASCFSCLLYHSPKLFFRFILQKSFRKQIFPLSQIPDFVSSLLCNRRKRDHFCSRKQIQTCF